MNITYSKFKMGEEVVREIAEPPTYSKLILVHYKYLTWFESVTYSTFCECIL